MVWPFSPLSFHSQIIAGDSSSSATRPHLVISSHHAKDRSRVEGKKWFDCLWQSDVHRRSQSEYKIKWKCNTMAWRLPATLLLYMMCLLKLTLCRGRTEFKMRLAPNSFRYTLPLQIRWTIPSPKADKSSSSSMGLNNPSLLKNYQQENKELEKNTHTCTYEQDRGEKPCRKTIWTHLS